MSNTLDDMDIFVADTKILAHEICNKLSQKSLAHCAVTLNFVMATILETLSKDYALEFLEEILKGIDSFKETLSKKP
jgi:hypothetical protein